MIGPMIKISILNILIIIGGSLFFLWSSESLSAPPENEVIAILNGKPLYRDEVEKKVAFRLYRLQGNIYTLLKDETEEIINQRLLADEAKMRGISITELLEKEVNQKIIPPDDKEIDAYLAKYPDEAGKIPDSRKRIRTYLHQKSIGQRRQEFFTSLREKADYKFLLQMSERPRMEINIEGKPWRGNPHALVTLVHFSSFTCSICKRSTRMIERAMKEYPGKIKWVHRNFFNMFDEAALRAAQMGDFARENGKFWEFHDKVLSIDGNLEQKEIFNIAETLNIDLKSYDDGEKEGRFLLNVKEDILDANRLGVTSTPVIFVNGRYFHGTFPYEKLKALIEEEMK